MDEKKSDLQIAVMIGVAAGIVFVNAFIAVLYVYPDPQNAIGMFVAPFYATWIAVAMGLMALGVLRYRNPDRNGSPPTILFVSGLILLFLISGYVASEIYQMTHPTRYPAR